MRRSRPLILTVLDGWGFSPRDKGNAIAAARKPTYDMLLREFPNSLIHTSGRAVGLPEGQMGNSEVGHMNMGAGRVVQMDVTRIDAMLASGEFFHHPLLLRLMHNAPSGRRLHLMGLLSDGGVHSTNQHLYALLRMARAEGVQDVFVHCFMDGRDTPPESGRGFIRELEEKMADYGAGRIASVSGRYYAMDRDKRWDRIERAKNAMVSGLAARATDAASIVERSYGRGVTDEFIEPVTIEDNRHQPISLIREGDSCFFFNYRADRGREMTEALSKLNLLYGTMTEYDKTFTCPFVLPREPLVNILGFVAQELNWTNLRVAETEKYAHVTYFFNGGVEQAFRGEERQMVPSPKVATYDLKPEMSAEGVTDVVIEAMGSRDFDLIVMNFANADMVGHSGKMDPVVRAVETVDACLGRIWQRLKEKNGRWIITADHGNAETMIDPVTGGPHTYHTTNPVPFILVDDSADELQPEGALRDIAPTILSVLGEAMPREMTGRDLRIKPA